MPFPSAPSVRAVTIPERTLKTSVATSAKKRAAELRLSDGVDPSLVAAASSDSEGNSGPMSVNASHWPHRSGGTGGGRWHCRSSRLRGERRHSYQTRRSAAVNPAESTSHRSSALARFSVACWSRRQSATAAGLPGPTERETSTAPRGHGFEKDCRSTTSRLLRRRVVGVVVSRVRECVRRRR